MGKTFDEGFRANPADRPRIRGEKNEVKNMVSGEILCKMHESMAEKTAAKKSKTKRNTEEDVLVQFRERRLNDPSNFNLKHPKPLPGYKSTLPGAPGNWAKEDPGA